MGEDRVPDNSSTATSADTSSVACYAGKFLTFRLDNEDYGIQILKVQEIIGMLNVTKVPRTPAFVRGVVNLRGKVIPVVDLRVRFGLMQQEDTEMSCIIVLQIQNGDREITTSIIVDEVSEVLEVDASQLEATPAFGSTIDTSYILAMGKVENRVIMLLDVDRVLSAEETAALAAMGTDE